MLVGPKFGFKLKLSFASSSRFNHLASQFENVQNCLTRPCGGADKDIFGGSDFILKLDTHQPLRSHQNIIFRGGGGKHRVHFLVDLVTISRFDSSNSKSIFCHCELSHPAFSSSGFLFYSRRHCRYMQTDDVLFLLFVASTNLCSE